VDFGDDGQQSVKARIASTSGSRVRLLTHPDKRVITEISVPAGSSWQEITLPLKYVPEGIHDIELSLSGEGMVEVDWIRFE